MKKLALLISLSALVFGFAAFRTAETSAVRFLTTLGISEEAAHDYVWSSFSGMYLSYPSIAKVKSMQPGDRATLTREISEFAKAYAASAEFKKKYLDYREGRKPTPPEKPKTAAQMKQEQKDNLQKSLRETEENMKKSSGDQKKMYESIVTTFKEQLKSLDDPKNTMFSPEMDKYMQQGYDMQVKEYNEKLAKWEKDNPTVPNEMIKRWLTEFLKVSKDVDFGAALVAGDGGKRLFAKTEYERKPDQWKMCFRAGKPVVDAGRAFAQQWLEELNKGK
jgi:hypothetical protein